MYVLLIQKNNYMKILDILYQSCIQICILVTSCLQLFIPLWKDIFEKQGIIGAWNWFARLWRGRGRNLIFVFAVGFQKIKTGCKYIWINFGYFDFSWLYTWSRRQACAEYSVRWRKCRTRTHWSRYVTKQRNPSV